MTFRPAISETKSSANLELQGPGFVEVVYYPKMPGHVAVKVEEFDIRDTDDTVLKKKQSKLNETRAGTRKYPAYYLSHGGNPAVDKAISLEEKQKKDTEYYNKDNQAKYEPIRIRIELPECSKDPNVLAQKISEFKNSDSLDIVNYKMRSNNCAFQARRFLNIVGFSIPENKLTTTPVYIATQACKEALRQNEQKRQAILNNTSLPKLDQMSELMKLEKERINIEKNLIRISQNVADWKSVNFISKVKALKNEKSDMNKKNMQEQHIDNCIAAIEITKQRPTEENHQRLLDALYVSYQKHEKLGDKKHAACLKLSIEQFPYDKLPDANNRRDFLLDVLSKLDRIEFQIRDKTIRTPLPAGMIELREKLKFLREVDPKNQASIDKSFDPREIHKAFFEVQELLQEKNMGKGLKTQVMKDFYSEYSNRAEAAMKNTYQTPKPTSTITQEIPEIAATSTRRMSR